MTIIQTNNEIHENLFKLFKITRVIITTEGDQNALEC